MIVCAGHTEQFDFAYPIGVGLVESSINLARLALLDRPDFLLFIGTAGSYGQYDIFQIVHSQAASQIELSFWEKRSYTPIDNVIESEGLNVSRETIVNSSNYITTDKESWKYFTKHNIGLENMEFFSVLKVAQEFEIPAGGIFVVTNMCDTNAHKEYRKNLPKAKKSLEEYVKERFKL